MTPPNPPSELLLVYCFNWLCLVRHIPSICTDLTALTEGNHVSMMTEDKLLRVHWRWISDRIAIFPLSYSLKKRKHNVFLYIELSCLLIFLNVY